MSQTQSVVIGLNYGRLSAGVSPEGVSDMKFFLHRLPEIYTQTQGFAGDPKTWSNAYI